MLLERARQFIYQDAAATCDTDTAHCRRHGRRHGRLCYRCACSSSVLLAPPPATTCQIPKTTIYPPPPPPPPPPSAVHQPPSTVAAFIPSPPLSAPRAHPFHLLRVLLAKSSSRSSRVFFSSIRLPARHAAISPPSTQLGPVRILGSTASCARQSFFPAVDQLPATKVFATSRNLCRAAQNHCRRL